MEIEINQSKELYLWNKYKLTQILVWNNFGSKEKSRLEVYKIGVNLKWIYCSECCFDKAVPTQWFMCHSYDLVMVLGHNS